MTDLQYEIKPLPPNKLSAWIKASVEDAQRLEKTPGFIINMTVFNELDEWSDDNNICEVCMGGAAIVGRGLTKPGNGFGTHTGESIAIAIDMVRTGHIKGAITNFYEDFPDLKFGVYIPNETLNVLENMIKHEYEDTYDGEGDVGARASWETYLKVADELEELGY